MKKDDIINAYLRIREIDNTIPDDVLDFMKKSFFELITKEIECIDSNRSYTLYNLTVWLYYPSFEKISPTEKLIDFCENTKQRLLHEKKINITKK